MLSLVVTILEKLGLALLGTFFQSTAQATQSSGVDASALDYLYQLVDSAQKNGALSTPDAQYDFIFSEAVNYFRARGMDIAVSLAESLVALAVHHYNTANNTTAPTISTLAAKAAS